MNKKFYAMTYKEFKKYCNDRACDGKWSIEEAIFCVETMKDIDKIEIKILGIKSKKKTDEAREEKWKEFLINMESIY